MLKCGELVIGRTIVYQENNRLYLSSFGSAPLGILGRRGMRSSDARCLWILRLLWSRRSTAITVAAPLLLLPLVVAVPEGLTQEASSCLYVLLLMAVYWMTEAIDISATALLPMLLLPLLGVMKSGDVARSYQKDTIMLIIGGFLVAVAVESSNIHKRISVFMLRLAGSNMRMLMLGFMIPTWFLSMWMSNTATTAVMVPIVKAVISELNLAAADEDTDASVAYLQDGVNTGNEASRAAERSEIQMETHLGGSTFPSSTAALQEASEEAQEDHAKRKNHEEWLNVNKALTLCVCYSSTIGGMATLTGNPSNVVLVEDLQIISRRHQNYDFKLNFVTWMVMGLPISVILLILCWLLLQALFLGIRCNKNSKGHGAHIKKIIVKEYEKLGTISFNEVIVVFLVILLVALWLGRDPGNAGGWQQLFKQGYVSDTTAVMVISLVLFIAPSKRPYMTGASGKITPPSDSCLTWKAVHEKMPWGVVILIGGGFALAEAIEVSGLAEVISHALGGALSGLPDWGLVITISTISALVTQMTSNTTVATLFLPIIGLVAEENKIHPLYIMFPACLSTSFAFMLPVATPSNAIVFSTGNISIIDMVKGGTILTILGILIATVSTISWGRAYFQMEWLLFEPSGNTTAASNGSTLLFNSTSAEL